MTQHVIVQGHGLLVAVGLDATHVRRDLRVEQADHRFHGIHKRASGGRRALRGPGPLRVVALCAAGMVHRTLQH